MASVEFLTAFSILLLIGIIVTYISKKMRIPNVIALLLSGILLREARINDVRLFEFSTEFLTAVAIIGLIMIVFDSSSRLPLRSVSKDTEIAFEITFLFIILEFTIFSVAARYIGNLSWSFAILLASVLVGTDPSAVLSILKDLKHRVIPILNVEALFNTPLTVIIPFVVLEISKTFNLETIVSQFIEQISPFLQQVVTGVGAGIVVAIIAFRIMKYYYSEALSPVTFIASALLTYTLAEGLGGNGVLAVTTLGLVFGNVYLKKKEKLKTFGSLLSNLFEILIFLLFGLSITLPLSLAFYFRGLFLFMVYLLIRAAVIFFVFRNKKFEPKEKLFMSLNTSKGVALGVVAFTLLSIENNVLPVVELSLLFILYSVILATFVAHFSKWFLGVAQMKEKQE